jgi:transcriptional regulator with XRE-family HTH domain
MGSVRPGTVETAATPRTSGRTSAARRELGLTQSELARRAGVKLDTLRSIEQGKTRNPGILTVLRLAEELNVTLDSLVRP